MSATIDLRASNPSVLLSNYIKHEGTIRSALSKLSAWAYREMGAGDHHNSYQMLFSKVNRFSHTIGTPNMESSGLTFITRPELNLTLSSIKQDDTLAMLASDDPNSIAFGIKCMLDARLARGEVAGPERSTIELASKSQLIDNRLPFIVPLCNSIESITGFPDLTLDTETSDGGYMGEDQTTARGSDLMQNTNDISISFKEIHGGINMAILYYWVYWTILAVQRGTVVAYPDDIAELRMCYTTSIYRFVLDPKKRTILKWAKATGCFPVNVPIGNTFNFSEGEDFLSAAMKFSVTFKANHIEYFSPSIFLDFNKLMARFAGRSYHKSGDKLPPEAKYNLMGLPWIDVSSGRNELCFIGDKKEADSSLLSELDEVIARIRQS